MCAKERREEVVEKEVVNLYVPYGWVVLLFFLLGVAVGFVLGIVVSM